MLVFEPTEDTAVPGEAGFPATGGPCGGTYLDPLRMSGER